MTWLRAVWAGWTNTPNLVESHAISHARRDSLGEHVPMTQGQGVGPVLLVSSQGGHLTHLLALRSWWEEKDHVWVCPDTPDVADRLEGERVVTSYFPTTRNVPNLLRNTKLALKVLRGERPSLVVSSGAAVAVPFFVLAWAMRIPTVFIEVYDRVDTPTLTGRLCGPFATRRIVQWQSQLEFYPDASLVGPLL